MKLTREDNKATDMLMLSVTRQSYTLLLTDTSCSITYNCTPVSWLLNNPCSLSPYNKTVFWTSHAQYRYLVTRHQEMSQPKQLSYRNRYIIFHQTVQQNTGPSPNKEYNVSPNKNNVLLKRIFDTVLLLWPTLALYNSSTPNSIIEHLKYNMWHCTLSSFIQR